jgi:hypothetical protein
MCSVEFNDIITVFGDLITTIEDPRMYSIRERRLLKLLLDGFSAENNRCLQIAEGKGRSRLTK